MTTVESAQEIGAAFTPATVAPIRAIRAKLVDLWPVTVVSLAVGLTLAWTGLLMSVLWWGFEWLVIA